MKILKIIEWVKLFMMITVLCLLITSSCKNLSNVNNNETEIKKDIPDTAKVKEKSNQIASEDNYQIEVISMDINDEYISKESQIKKIRKEFNHIESASLVEDKRYYHNEENMDYARYAAYYDDGELVKLLMEGGEGQFSIDCTYYLQNNEVFFAYFVSIEGQENETQERIYFYKNEIIEALIKEGTTPLDGLENKPHTRILNDLKGGSKSILNTYRKYLSEYESADIVY